MGLGTCVTDELLTVGNVRRGTDASVFVEQNNPAHNQANLLERLQSVVWLERRKVLDVVLGHDGVQRARDLSHHLGKIAVAKRIN
jgi:hypothetical protein